MKIDLSDFDSTVKAEKANAIQTLTQLFRLQELCLALILLSWIFNKLPFAVQISGQLFRLLAASSLFVFLLSNAIIATLIAKSDKFPGENHGTGTELYEELIKNTDNSTCPRPFLSENPDPLLFHAAKATDQITTRDEEVEYQEKHIIVSEENTVTQHAREKDDGDHEPNVETYTDSDSDGYESAKIRKTKSEKNERSYGIDKKELRRWETEKLRSRADQNMLFGEDELSDEEFQRAIDEFIAKQLMFRRQESMYVCCCSKPMRNCRS